MSSVDERKQERDRAAAVARRRASAHRVRFLGGVLATVLLASVVGLGYRLLSSAPGEPLDATPGEVLGTWTTSLERYAGASLTIEPDRLTIGFTPGEASEYRIRSIRREATAVHRAYRIVYEDQDGPQEMEIFVYDDGQMRLRNPFEAVWTRNEGR